MEEVHKKNKLTQWGLHILMSILMSHMMVTKNPQNVHRNYFWAILLTFIFDIKIDINICEPHYVNLFFLWTSSIVCMFDFLIFDIFLTTWHLFDILTHQLNLNHLSPHRAIFSYQKAPFENFAIYGLRLRHHEFFSMSHCMSCTWVGRSKMMWVINLRML